MNPLLFLAAALVGALIVLGLWLLLALRNEREIDEMREALDPPDDGYGDLP